MRGLIVFLFLLLALPLQAAKNSDQVEQQAIDQLDRPLYNPFAERYLLDEVRALRMEL